MKFTDTLKSLEAKATDGIWYVDRIERPDGYALAWLGNVFIDTDAPKMGGFSRYKDPAYDAELIAYLRNHAQEIINLVEAAENHGCGWKIEDPRSTKPCEICEALAALNKEQS